MKAKKLLQFSSSKNSYDLISPLKEMIDCWYFQDVKKAINESEQFLTDGFKVSVLFGESLEVTYKKIKIKMNSMR